MARAIETTTASLPFSSWGVPSLCISYLLSQVPKCPHLATRLEPIKASHPPSDACIDVPWE